AQGNVSQIDGARPARHGRCAASSPVEQAPTCADTRFVEAILVSTQTNCLIFSLALKCAMTRGGC
ncbi:MAG: hypothetical protein VYD57_06690, partial [Pseudomonadota bacterium]|nr:hypothetical protein [Pseudomonadota bacterium]